MNTVCHTVQDDRTLLNNTGTYVIIQSVVDSIAHKSAFDGRHRNEGVAPWIRSVAGRRLRLYRLLPPFRFASPHRRPLRRAVTIPSVEEQGKLT